MLAIQSYDDKTLFSQIAEGAEPAFRILFDRYKAKIYYFILGIIKSSADTEELVQDVFFRLWISRHALAEVENPSTYLFVMARNRSLDHLKKITADRRLKNELIAKGEPDVNLTEQEFFFRESRKILEQAVHDLPAQQQKVYRLSREAGLSREQIADQLGISPNTVKNHLADAMAALRTAMQGIDPIVLLILLTPLWYK